jgi:hypothetical protein
MTSALERIATLTCQIGCARAELRTAVAEARAAGASWATVAKALGISPQAAHRKYGPKPQDVEALPLSDPLFDPLFNTPQE